MFVDEISTYYKDVNFHKLIYATSTIQIKTQSIFYVFDCANGLKNACRNIRFTNI